MAGVLGGCDYSVGAETPVHESLEQLGSFSDDDIRHLLVRTHFGVTQREYDRVVEMGVPGYVDAMLALPAVGSTAWDRAADQELVNSSDPPGLEGKYPSESQLARWWLHMMVASEHPFQECVALFWHEHFAASSAGLGSSHRYWMKDHVNLFRGSGTGNLRQLLLDVSRDPTMLKWLDGVISTAAKPNENYGREFWELFTLGVDNGYTEDDIKESANALTGYRTRYDSNTSLSRVEFDTSRHHDGHKIVFGEVIWGQNQTDDYEALVDLTLQHKQVAEFIAKKILTHFCYEDPPDRLVNNVAALLRSSNWELKPVFRTLFLSDAFYSSKSRAGLVRSPVERALGFIRSTGLRILISDLDNSVRDMAQRPTQPPDVNGWPGGRFWLSAQPMVDHANFLRRVIVSRSYQSSAGIDVADLLPNSNATPAEVVDRLTWLLRLSLSTDERTAFIQYLNTERLSNGDVVDSPFDPTNPSHLDERLRGLLYILGQHPTFLIR